MEYVKQVKCIVTNYMVSDLANIVIEYFDPIVYNIYDQGPDSTYMNWVGDYTYGSTFVRGTRLSFRPEHVLFMNLDYAFESSKFWTRWIQTYERDSAKFRAPLPLSDFNVLFWNENSNALSFEEPTNFNSIWNLMPSTFETFWQCSENVKTKWDGDAKQKLKGTYSFVFVSKYDDRMHDIYFVFAKEYDTIQKIREEMNQVFEIGKTNNVTYEWV